MVPDDVKLPDQEVWLENVQTVDVYMGMRTQWIYADFGIVGLNYASLPVVMKVVGVKRKDQAGVFEGIRLMEAVELSTIRQHDKRQRRNGG